MRAPLGWLGIVRLGLVQTALGAIVVMTTSTINRVMVVELALAGLRARRADGAALRRAGACVRAGATARTSGGRRTPWIIGGMAVLALGGTLAALGTALDGESSRRRASPSRVVAFLPDRHRRRRRRHLAAGAARDAASDAARRARRRHHRLDHDDRRLRDHGASGRPFPRSVLAGAARRRHRRRLRRSRSSLAAAGGLGRRDTGGRAPRLRARRAAKPPFRDGPARSLGRAGSAPLHAFSSSSRCSPTARRISSSSPSPASSSA